MLSQSWTLSRVIQTPVVIVGREGALYSFTAPTCFQYFEECDTCVSGIFDGGEFREKFAKPGSELLLF